MTQPDKLHEFEKKLRKFPPVGLIPAPTPFHFLKRLSEHLGGPKIWIKRDDATHISCGGNKIRKLDRVLRPALDEGYDTLVSGGVAQSNSQRQVATAAAMLGLDCHLVVYQGRVEQSSEAYDSSGNVVLNKLLGARFHNVDWEGDRNSAIENLSQELSETGKKPFAIPYGVSNAMGTISYSTVVLEIARQSHALGFSPQAIIASSGSGGTQAGLVVGASNCLPDTKIIGVDVDAEPERVKTDVTKFASAASALLGCPFDSRIVEVTSGFAGPSYGVPHTETIEAMRLMGRLEAIILDPVYTGKAFAALRHLIKNDHFSREDNVVFVHTGGMPATFAYSHIF